MWSANFEDCSANPLRLLHQERAAAPAPTPAFYADLNTQYQSGCAHRFIPAELLPAAVMTAAVAIAVMSVAMGTRSNQKQQPHQQLIRFHVGWRYCCSPLSYGASYGEGRARVCAVASSATPAEATHQAGAVGQSSIRSFAA